MPSKKATPSTELLSNLPRDTHASKHPDRHHLGKSSGSSSNPTPSSSSSSSSSSTSKQLLERSAQKKSSAPVATPRPVQDEVDLAVAPRAKKRKTTELEHLLNSF
jgi:hypothetical protein